ncbi:hypothetical protein TSAR_003278 [Trichomalopsis sarcophagae]|uniref:Uncharacterized protein n=1 Tax=Trichomalopsis sarcophagae TaxID=543379 RepID=A0A232FE98_9HYME|nr:hypothetical protein TSAR_003278 [Trichomalopsis sarcophagae]
MTLHWWMHWFWVTAQIVDEPDRSKAFLPCRSCRRSSSDERTSTQPGRIPGKKETKITWIQAFSKPPRPKSSSSPEPPTSGEELLTPKVQTARCTAGLLDSTRLGRARGTFTSQFQREQLAREERNKDEATGSIPSGSGASATEIATITGGCLAIILLLSTLGSLAFVVYRRRYLNPPQTLNSDKCSNPDSSGYIDDSTIRDNSEEMYSLDNDSFLNSLEAMTIQNYWTDSVKHTKL